MSIKLETVAIYFYSHLLITGNIQIFERMRKMLKDAGKRVVPFIMAEISPVKINKISGVEVCFHSFSSIQIQFIELIFFVMKVLGAGCMSSFVN